jgi:YcaO-like protein with predicted kinase domain
LIISGRDYRQTKSHLHGTHRTRTPEQTVDAFSPLMPHFGITRLANVTGLDCLGIPVYVSIRPNSRSLSVSQGKGVTDAAAKASALMESIELWHAERVRVPLVFESFDALARRGRVADVENLSRRPGLELDPRRPILWALGYDLIRGVDTWVPYEMVSLNLVGSTYEEAIFEMSSNGLASGNHLLEAIEHGLCELIERDAITMWWLQDQSKLAEYRVDLDTVQGDCRTILDKLEAAEMQVAIWDITSDTDVPAYMCALTEKEGRVGWRTLGAFWGYGCHLSKDIAICRAVTEAAQARLTIIAGSRDDNFKAQYQRQTNAHALETLRERMLSGRGTLDFSRRESKSTSAFDTDVEYLLEALRKIDIDSAIAVDLTHEELGVPVVKVIVPGLEGYHWHETYRPGKRALAREGHSQ